jgi:hypothetical protein
VVARKIQAINNKNKVGTVWVELTFTNLDHIIHDTINVIKRTKEEPYRLCNWKITKDHRASKNARRINQYKIVISFG